jgi:site-specific DNA-methyltransferase (adenine-specific)
MAKLTPYYQRDGITIYLGDCLKVMPQIIGQFDAIIADLPYGTTACSWDEIIPFEPLWENYKRLIKKNGAIILFGSQPFTSKLVMSNLEWFKYEWILEKNTATNVFNSERQPVRYHENILVFYDEQPTYNKQMAKRKDSAKGRVKSGIKSSPKTSNHYKGIKDGYRRFYNIEIVNPKSVVHFNSVPNCNGMKLHPTQKPVDLLAYLIRTYTNPGEIILDNTAGSFTTAIACIKEGRRFVGIEKEESYCEIGKQRVIDALRQPSFFSLPNVTREKPKQLELIEGVIDG